MNQHARLQGVCLALALLPLAGCITPGPFGVAEQDATSLTQQPDSGTPYQWLARAFPERNASRPSQLADPSAAPGNPILTSWERVSDSLAGTFSIQPKRIPAWDPVSLSSQPPVVGGDLHYHAARVYESKNEMEQAISHYSQALEQSPQDVHVMVGLARVHDRVGDLQNAELLYSRAAALEPQNVAVLNDLGLCFAKQGKQEAAVGALSRAIQLSPNSKRYRNNIAAVLVNAGRTQEAWHHLAAVHGEAAAHYNVGFLLSKRGHSAPARQHLTAALQADPYLQPARQMLARLEGQPPTQTVYGQSPGAPARAAQPVNYPPQSAGDFRNLPPL